MRYTGILVVASPGAFSGLEARLRAFPGLEVRYREPAAGRLVLVQESPSRAAAEAQLRRLQALPEVAFAAPVIHVVASEEGS